MDIADDIAAHVGQAIIAASAMTGGATYWDSVSDVKDDDFDSNALLQATDALDLQTNAPDRDNFLVGLTAYRSWLMGLKEHFAVEGTDIDTYLNGAGERVHHYFDILYRLLMGVHLDALNVFYGSMVTVGVCTAI